MEVEAKFCIPDEGAFQRLLQVAALGGFRLGEVSVAELYDRYLDTVDGALRAGGYACRLRCQDARYQATLKGLGGVSGAIHRRAEHEVELPGPLPPQEWPPGAARDLALQLIAGQPLIRLFDLRQTRHSRPLHLGDRVVGELNLDRVRIYRGDDLASSFLELEAEVSGSGSPEDLEQLAAEIQVVWDLEPQAQSKFERGLAVLGLGPAPGFKAGESSAGDPPYLEQGDGLGTDRKVGAPRVEPPKELDIDPDDSMSEAGRKVLRLHYLRMVYHEPGTRLGEDIEALHDMRVATRRMRAAFYVFGAFFDPKTLDPHLKGLKRTGRTLGAVRDLDVFRAKIEIYLDTGPPSQRGGLDGLVAVLEARREAARERMIAYLDGEKYARFRERFGQFLETEGMGGLPIAAEDGGPRPYRVRHVAPMAIYERLAEVRAYDEWVSIPQPPVERLHALRIACKRLRYTMEFFLDVLGPEARPAIKEVIAMQDHLGDLQDAVVASGILQNLIRWGTWDHDAGDTDPSGGPESAASLGMESYLAAKRAEMHHLLDTFPDVWQQINGNEFSRLVAGAVAVL